MTSRIIVEKLFFLIFRYIEMSCSWLFTILIILSNFDILSIFWNTSFSTLKNAYSFSWIDFCVNETSTCFCTCSISTWFSSSFFKRFRNATFSCVASTIFTILFKFFWRLCAWRRRRSIFKSCIVVSFFSNWTWMQISCCKQSIVCFTLIKNILFAFESFSSTSFMIKRCKRARLKNFSIKWSTFFNWFRRIESRWTISKTKWNVRKNKVNWFKRLSWIWFDNFLINDSHVITSSESTSKIWTTKTSFSKKIFFSMISICFVIVCSKKRLMNVFFFREKVNSREWFHLTRFLTRDKIVRIAFIYIEYDQSHW